jgi:AraC-type DNA-binding domain-containing proteins
MINEQIQDRLSVDFISDDSNLVYETSTNIPGAVHYALKRYIKPIDFVQNDAGMINYQYQKQNKNKNNLELLFCTTGNMYCNQMNCNTCVHGMNNCRDSFESVDVLRFIFTPSLLSQYSISRDSENTISNDLLNFKYTESFTKSFSMCGRTRMVLNGLINHSFTDSLENIFVNAQSQMVLLYSLDCMDEKEPDLISCKFLANEADQEKIINARQILLDHIGEPITIKILSRKVGMNECYLKKGFRELFGTTIFEFYQSQRMEHAKYLLYEKGLTVTEVSVLLGYSSISHFSTAFKKHTGLKPCELLLR